MTLLELMKEGKIQLQPIKVEPSSSQYAIGFYYNDNPHIIPNWERYSSFEECKRTLARLAIPEWQLALIKLN